MLLNVIKYVLQYILKICICIKQYVLHTYYIFATDTSVMAAVAGSCFLKYNINLLLKNRISIPAIMHKIFETNSSFHVK